MRRMLYLMHLPWGWIKQRPHFLAESLDRYFEVTVVVRQSFARIGLVSGQTPPQVPVQVVPMLRLTSYLGFMDRLNNKLINRRLRQLVRAHDLVWITHPDMFELVREVIPPAARVIYDCMDNYPAFPAELNRPGRAELLVRRERQLLARCDAVFVSSAALRETVTRRHGLELPMVVVNNAISPGDGGPGAALPTAIQEHFKRASFCLTYIGTVAPWLDLPLLVATVERFPEVTVFLVGPCEVELPRHERIVQLGPVEHCQVAAVMAASDALFMPFCLNDLVRDVDPVKLYEYVASGKPALAPDYAESRKFADFVHLYADGEELWRLLRELLAGTAGARQPLPACQEFARVNTWTQRAAQIAQHLGVAAGKDAALG